MNQTRDQQRFTISEVAADWHEPMVPQHPPKWSGGVDCGRRWRNVYDKKLRRYAKDCYRTAHLTARSDKSVAYVTNNKRLDATFCTVEANYWQTLSIARPLCDSRATWLLASSSCHTPTRLLLHQGVVMWPLLFVCLSLSMQDNSQTRNQTR